MCSHSSQIARFCLLLDNCEHVSEGAADLADRILDESPQTVMLATSRAPLAVVGESRFLLEPLGVPERAAVLTRSIESDAVRLFSERGKER